MKFSKPASTALPQYSTADDTATETAKNKAEAMQAIINNAAQELAAAIAQLDPLYYMEVDVAYADGIAANDGNGAYHLPHVQRT